MTHMISRRQLLGFTGMGLVAANMPVSLSFAKAPGNKRLLVVILRGGMDGLGALIPYGETGYADVRGNIAVPQNDQLMIKLDDRFALHAAMKPLYPLYQNKELLLMHAVATPYRDRSHFDVQNVLEIGADRPHLYKTGWLNRAIDALPKTPEVIAIGTSVPLILRGDARVGSWSPATLPEADAEFLSRVRELYATDAVLLEALENAEAMKEIGTDIQVKGGRNQFISWMQKTASFMAPDNGAHIASIDLNGWDTHSGQGLDKGRLPDMLTQLSEGLVAFKKDMGDAWKDTAVLVVTEFGRTVRGNGTGGTDHGTASLAMLLGGSVNGGRIVGDWPGLSKLYDDRDLMPANDMRSLFKAVANQHLGVDANQLEAEIFPDSRSAMLNEKVIL